MLHTASSGSKFGPHEWSIHRLGLYSIFSISMCGMFAAFFSVRMGTGMR